MTPEEFHKLLKEYKYHSCCAVEHSDVLACQDEDSELWDEIHASYESNRDAASMIEGELINAYKNIYDKIAK